MSYSELKAFNKDGDAVCLEEFRNSHYILVIWNMLAEKYGVVERLLKEVVEADGLTFSSLPEVMRRAYGFQVRGMLMRDMTPVWDLQHGDTLEDDDWYALMFTFDNVVVPPELIERVAHTLESIKVPTGVVDHGAGFAACMRTAVKEIEDIRGIALYATSICDDPWGHIRLPLDACTECGTPVRVNDSGRAICSKEPEAHYLEHEWRPYNLDLDDRHKFMPTREAHMEECEREEM